MLTVQNLQKSYNVKGKTVAALKGVSFSVREGEILGIVGKSGGGKSTLMRILRGIDGFDAGRIVLDGLEITPESSEDILQQQRLITAIHLQREFGLWTESSLKNVVRRVYSRIKGYEALPIEEDADYEKYYDEARTYLDMVGLKEKELHLATILSGGEKQRLMIARQLAKKPKLLLLDEPATMACPKTKQEVLDTIKKVNRELKLTTLVVSHLPEVHEYLADRLIWLDDGEIREEGDPPEVIRKFMSGIGPAEPLPARPVPDPAIRVRRLYKRNYLVGVGEVLKIANMNLAINRGETTAIIGSSGAGKTTLLMIMQGLRMPDKGNIYYRLGDRWVDLTEFTPDRMEVRRNIGIMYQEFALMPGETILEQIAYKLGVKGVDVLQHARETARQMGISEQVLDTIYTMTDMHEEDAKAALEKLGLSRDIFSELFPRFPATEARKFAEPIFKLMDLDQAVMDKLPDQLSGGESVRATLAILLAANPKILILDEPFGDIDPVTLREVANAMKRIQKTYATTILLVSHHVDLVREVAHRAVLIENGRIELDGDPDEVSTAFVSRCGATYIRDRFAPKVEGGIGSA